ncbi:indole-3-glycerol phosphate synthase/phosphoribosylanthranilate isomerase [Aggregatibacter actinomycetemcomitans NUM4039]|nr:indole-3-glycerol phosphate synthase/phosphoribosylanthranilate isomerase [Aggregatibacter actinomycetemcomitans NUM4039]
MITQDFSKPLEAATVLQKIVLDKAQWVKAKAEEFPLSAFEKTSKNPTALFMVRWRKVRMKSRHIFWNVKKPRLPKD